MKTGDSGSSRTLTDPAAQRATETEARPRDLGEVDPERYEVEGEVARGGMGRILRAVDRRLDRPVAIKKLLDPEAGDREAFEREARITARLQHPSIVAVYEAGRLPDGESFYAMKLVSGRSLKEAIAEAGDLEGRVALMPAVTAVCDALAYAHRQRVVHRDLKPSNVLVGEFGETVVIDWGLAIELDDDSEPPGVAGTPAYMAPEQHRGGAVDERTDVYALGALLFAVLTGRAPGERGAGALDDVDLPGELVAICHRAMASDPARRYPSAVELADDLRRFQTGKLVDAHRYSRRELVWRWARRHRAPLLVATAALVVVVAGGVLAVSRVVRERDVAAERADRLTLASARLQLERDPLEALRALDSLADDSPSWGAARVIAADAMARGVGVVIGKHRGAVTHLAAGERGAASASAAPELFAYRADGAAAPVRGVSGPVTGLAVARSAPVAFAIIAGREIARVDLERGEATPIGRGDFAGGRIAADPSGRALAIAAAGSVERWSAAGRRLARRSLGDLEPAALAIDGPRWWALGPGGAVIDLETGAASSDPPAAWAQRRRLIEAAGLAASDAVAVSAAGDRIAGGGRDGSIAVWSDGGRRRLHGHRAAVLELAFAGGALVSGAADGEVRRWIAGERAVELGGHGAWIGALVFAGGDLLSAGYDGTVRRWNLAEPGAVEVLRGHAGPVRALAATADGAVIASGSDDRTVRRWRGGAGEIAATHLGVVLDVAISESGALIASAGSGGQLKLSRPVGPVVSVTAHRGAVRAIDLAGGRLLSVGDDGFARLWSPGGRAIAEVNAGAPLLAGALSADGEIAALGAADGAVSLWRWRRGELEVLGRHAAAVRHVAIDRGRVASASDDRRAAVWRRGRPPIWLRGHRDLVVRARFFAGGLVTASEDGTARIWALPTGESRVLEHGPWLADVAIDGDRLATGGGGSTIRLWRDPLPRAPAELRAWLRGWRAQ